MTKGSSRIYEASKPLPKSTTNNSKRSVPTSFKLLNHTIRVKENPAHPDTDKYGVAEYPKNEIRLYTQEEGDSIAHHTFCHELVHFLFYYAGRQDLAEDEVLVDVLGGLLAQYEATKRP